MSKKIKGIPVWLSVALLWVGIGFGAGVAAGRSAVQYFARHGWTAVWMPVVTWALVALAYYFCCEWARLAKANSYKEFAEGFFFPKAKRWVLLFFDINVVVCTAVGIASLMASGGSLFNQALGINYMVGVLLTAAVAVFAVAFGRKALLKWSDFLTIAIFVTMMTIAIVLIKNSNGTLGQIIGTQMMPENTSMGSALQDAVTYAGTQVGSLPGVLAMACMLSSKRDVKKAIGSGLVLNAIVGIVMSLTVLAHFYTVLPESLPIFTVLTQLQNSKGGLTIILVFYQVLLFGAIITSASGQSFGTVERFMQYGKKLMPSDTVRRTVYLAICMGIGIALSAFGLVAIVAKGYAVISYFNLPIMLFAIIAGPYRVKQMKKRGEEDSDRANATE